MFHRIGTLLALILFTSAVASPGLESTEDGQWFQRRARAADPEVVQRIEDELKKELESETTNQDEYINEWAVYIPAGQEEATAVAKDLEYVNLGQVH